MLKQMQLLLRVQISHTTDLTASDNLHIFRARRMSFLCSHVSRSIRATNVIISEGYDHVREQISAYGS